MGSLVKGLTGNWRSVAAVLVVLAIVAMGSRFVLQVVYFVGSLMPNEYQCLVGDEALVQGVFFGV